jgi:hypothetical protein
MIQAKGQGKYTKKIDRKRDKELRIDSKQHAK